MKHRSHAEAVKVLTPPSPTDSNIVSPSRPQPPTTAVTRPMVDPGSALSALRSIGRDSLPVNSSSICRTLQRCAAPAVMRQLSTDQLCSAVAELGRLRLDPVPLPFLLAAMKRTAADEFQGITARQLCCSLIWGLAAAGAQPLSITWLLAALRAIHAVVDDMDSRCIHSLCSALESWGVMEIVRQDRQEKRRSQGVVAGLAAASHGPSLDQGAATYLQDTSQSLGVGPAWEGGAGGEQRTGRGSADQDGVGGSESGAQSSAAGSDDAELEEEGGDDEDEDDALLTEWRAYVESSPASDEDMVWEGGQGALVLGGGRSRASTPEMNAAVLIAQQLVDRLWLRMVQCLDACTLHELGAVMCTLGGASEAGQDVPAAVTTSSFVPVQSSQRSGAESGAQRDVRTVHADDAAVLQTVEDLLLVCTDTEEVEQVHAGLVRMGIQVPESLQRSFAQRHQWR
ncbi:MAG: hypothetical protein WDW38_003108 [Sanguina aurantia]